jgi:predicted dinucleotide-binding enzyme
MKIGILGCSNVGKALGNSWARHKHEIMFGSRDPGSVEGSVHSGTIEEAARFEKVVVLALPWQAAHNLLSSLNLAGKTVIDCTNLRGPFPPSNGHHSSGAEALHACAPGAKLVKAFNTTGANNMASPTYPGGALVMFYRGDNAEAKETVEQLIHHIGFEPCDLGPLSNARLMEAQAELWIWLASRSGLGREFGFHLVRR